VAYRSTISAPQFLIEKEEQLDAIELLSRELLVSFKIFSGIVNPLLPHSQPNLTLNNFGFVSFNRRDRKLFRRQQSP